MLEKLAHLGLDAVIGFLVFATAITVLVVAEFIYNLVGFAWFFRKRN
jgi:hypothetical protein